MNEQQNYGVYIKNDYVTYGEKKTLWQRIGTAFKNDEQAINIVLNALPLPEPHSKTAKLYLRMPRGRSKSSNYPNSYTLFDEPQEAR